MNVGLQVGIHKSRTVAYMEIHTYSILFRQISYQKETKEKKTEERKNRKGEALGERIT